jgi:hypothetical protein
MLSATVDQLSAFVISHSTVDELGTLPAEVKVRNIRTVNHFKSSIARPQWLMLQPYC